MDPWTPSHRRSFMDEMLDNPYSTNNRRNSLHQESWDFEALKKDFFSLDLNVIIPAHRLLAENFICTICHMVCFQLVECPTCQSTTCSSCFRNYTNCTNRCYGQMIPLSKKSVRIAKQINAKCQNKECDTISTFEEYLKHSKSCKFEMLTCQEKGCEFQTIRANFSNFHKECPHTMIECKHCKKKFKRKEIETHQNSCDMRVVSCTINSECKVVIKAKDLKSHLEGCQYRLVDCKECEANMMFKEKKDHSCIKYLKGELRQMCENMKMLEARMEIYEKEKPSNQRSFGKENVIMVQKK